MTLRHPPAIVAEIRRLAEIKMRAREIGKPMGMTEMAVWGVCRRHGIGLGGPRKSSQVERVRVAPPPPAAPPVHRHVLVSDIPPPSRERLMAGR